MRNTRTVIALALSALLLAMAVPAFAADAFSAADLNVNSIAANASPDEVRSALGEPATAKTSTEAATGNALEVWAYDGLTLTFTSGKLTGADWTNPALIGPRGLRIGDTQATVQSAFMMNGAQTDATVLYSAGLVEATGAQLPPCGTVSVQPDGSVTVLYLAPVTPYSADVLADPASYVYQSHAALTLSLSADTQSVVGIHWALGPLAE